MRYTTKKEDAMINNKIKEVDALKRRKREKLAHYARRDLVEFRQLDGFANVQEDSVMHRDADGDDCWTSRTEELMTGAYGVRILITKGTTMKDALRLIDKLVGWLKREPELLEFKDASDMEKLPF